MIKELRYLTTEDLSNYSHYLVKPSYFEVSEIGRYIIEATFSFDNYFRIGIYRKAKESFILKAVITNEGVILGKLDGEGANLVNRIVKRYLL